MTCLKVVPLEEALVDYENNLVCGDLNLIDACALASAMEAGILERDEVSWCFPENYAYGITAGYVIVTL